MRASALLSTLALLLLGSPSTRTHVHSDDAGRVVRRQYTACSTSASSVSGIPPVDLSPMVSATLRAGRIRVRPQVRIRLRRSREVPRSAARWTGEILAGASRELDVLLGPAPLDGEVILLGLRDLPSSWELDVCRPSSSDGHLEVIVYACEESCRPPWKELTTVVHELVHHWLRHGTMFRAALLPRWLEEGTADTIAGHVIGNLGGAAKGRPLPRLPETGPALRDLLSWRQPHELPDSGDFPRYDLAYHGGAAAGGAGADLRGDRRGAPRGRDRAPRGPGAGGRGPGGPVGAPASGSTSGCRHRARRSASGRLPAAPTGVRGFTKRAPRGHGERVGDSVPLEKKKR